MSLLVNHKNVLMLSESVSKKQDLLYELKLKKYDTFNFQYKWWINNTGSEARAAGNLIFENNEEENSEMVGKSKKAKQSTAFNGIHFMICKKNGNEIARYAIIINDENDKARTRVLFNE